MILGDKHGVNMRFLVDGLIKNWYAKVTKGQTRDRL
jgi:hypothetical protein